VSRTYLILGAAGMLGNACMGAIGGPDDRVLGTVRSAADKALFRPEIREHIIEGVDADDVRTVERVIADTRPAVVVNCIGVVKQLAAAEDPLIALPLNALFPHRLARICAAAGARLIHISTDCVFDGKRGLYRETDRPDADDLYGISKRLGEVDYPGAITLRTSIIGHELKGARSVVDWFLSQAGSVDGYTRAIFSGLPTVELARVIRDQVVPRPDLRGLYHVSADPISKFDLLRLVAETYGHDIEIVASERVVIDRSLDSTRFRDATSWAPPAWPELVRRMHAEAPTAPRGVSQ